MRVSVATLNTWGLPWPISSPPRAGRYPHIARYLRQAAFDVVALQEVWRGAPRLDIDDAHLHHAPDDGASGLATLMRARWRVVDARFRGYGKRRLLPWVEKGALHVHLADANGAELHIFNTHLQAYQKQSDSRRRAEQIEVLLELAGAADGPAIMMGDFNLYDGIARDRESAERIVSAGFRDSLGDAPPTPTYHSPSETERFDRIFVRDGGGVRIHVESHHVEHYRLGRRRLPFLSDHLPVEVTLRLE